MTTPSRATRASFALLCTGALLVGGERLASAQSASAQPMAWTVTRARVVLLTRPANDGAVAATAASGTAIKLISSNGEWSHVAISNGRGDETMGWMRAWDFNNSTAPAQVVARATTKGDIAVTPLRAGTQTPANTLTPMASAPKPSANGAMNTAALAAKSSGSTDSASLAAAARPASAARTPSPQATASAAMAATATRTSVPAAAKTPSAPASTTQTALTVQTAALTPPASIARPVSSSEVAFQGPRQTAAISSGQRTIVRELPHLRTPDLGGSWRLMGIGGLAAQHGTAFTFGGQMSYRMAPWFELVAEAGKFANVMSPAAQAEVSGTAAALSEIGGQTVLVDARAPALFGMAGGRFISTSPKFVRPYLTTTGGMAFVSPSVRFLRGGQELTAIAGTSYQNKSQDVLVGVSTGVFVPVGKFAALDFGYRFVRGFDHGTESLQLNQAIVGLGTRF